MQNDTKEGPRASRRVKMLLRRSLRAKAAGIKAFDKAREAIELARNLGLKPGQPVELELPNEATGEIEKRTYILHDNFVGDVAYKTASVPHYELKKLPKNPRSKPDPT